MAAPTMATLGDAEEELDSLMEDDEDNTSEIREKRQSIHRLRERIASIPWIDPFDLRYNNRVKQPKPTSQAVMFCIMDVSGSMDEQKRTWPSASSSCCTCSCSAITRRSRWCSSATIPVRWR